jgi:hypothetical protein
VQDFSEVFTPLLTNALFLSLIVFVILETTRSLRKK